MSKPLFAEDSDSGGELELGTNKEYAKSYNTFRQKELLKKLKDQDGSDSESGSDSDSSDDDFAVNPEFDEVFYKTLASLKEKDPKIYDKSTRFFDESIAIENTAAKEKKTKALTVKDYERKVLLEKGGIYEDDEEDDNAEAERPASPTYVEEQKTLKNEFKKIIDGDSEEEEGDGDDWGGIFKKREKTKEEAAKEEDEHQKWLADPANAVETNANLKPLKEFWSNPKLSRDEKFLRDYILTNGYADKDVEEIPTYDEIVADDDDDFEQQQTEFEHKYNFRFEDPDKDFIKRYPRTIEQSVRKTDDRRKEKRIEVRERKQMEKEEKLRDIEMLKELKRKEIEEKIEKLRAVTGDDELAFGEIDLDEDFDPEAHDKRMQEIFNNEYYQIDEGEEKPEVPSDIEDLQVENYDDYDPSQGARGDGDGHCEDDDFNMDCEYDSVAQRKSMQQELIESTRDKRKRRKRKSKFMEMLESDRPKFNPEDEKTYGQYLDEYYKLDCEDIIGDTPCRFKYVETAPNDFGLTIEEILMAKNKELNAWASMKKATQIRPEHIDRNEQEAFRKKARNEAMKRKILQSLYEESEDEEPEVVTAVSNPVPIPESKNQKKKKKKQAAAATVVSGALAAENKSSIVVTQSSANQPILIESRPVVKTETVEKNEPVAMKVNVKVNAKVEPTVVKTEPVAANVNVEVDAKVKSTVEKKVEPPAKKQPQPKKDLASQKPAPKRKHDGQSAAPANQAKKAKVNTNAPAALQPFKKFQKPKPNEVRTNGLTDARLEAFGINPKKFKKKLVYGQSNTPAQGIKQPAGKTTKKPLPQNKQKNANGKQNLAAHKNKLKKFLNKSK